MVVSDKGVIAHPVNDSAVNIEHQVMGIPCIEEGHLAHFTLFGELGQLFQRHGKRAGVGWQGWFYNIYHAGIGCQSPLPRKVVVCAAVFL